MSGSGYIKRAVVAGAVVGALVGYGEAAFVILFSKLYFTAAGKVGLILAAVSLYAAYGAAVTALLSGAWLLFFSARSWRAAVSTAVLSMAFIYCLAVLFSRGVLTRANLFSVRSLLVVAALLAASVALPWLGGLIGASLIRGKRGLIVVACAAVAVGILLFLPERKPGRPEEDVPPVVLVTIDTIRADRLRCYGNERVQTPVLDRLSSEGVLFEDAISQIPITNPSHLSILSSRYPHQTGVIDNWHKRPPGLPTIVDEFKERGYATAAFVSAFTLNSKFGFADGFDIYDDECSTIKGYGTLSLVRSVLTLMERAGLHKFRGLDLQRDARATNTEALSWLRRYHGSPVFLWVHYFDPHGPYTPPSPYSEMYYSGVKDDPDNTSLEGIDLPVYWTPDQSGFTDINYPIAQYDAEITYTDAELGRLVEYLDEKIGDYILVVVGDHGESLTEHGLYFHHGPGLYEEQIRVPLIIWSKGRVEPARVSSVVENIDIAPTIMEVAGYGVPAWCQGKSLVPLMRGEEPSASEGAVSETGGRAKDGTVDIAYRAGRYKLIMKPGEGIELYDIENDPLETVEISGEHEDIVKDLEEKIRSILISQPGEAGTVMDRETEEKLRSLGYLR